MKQGLGSILAPVDWHLDKLYDFLPGLGFPVIQATHSRYVVNLNRSPGAPLFGPEPSSIVPDATCFGRLLYDDEPQPNEVRERVDRYYVPYHERLAGLLAEMVRNHGRAYLVDLHGYCTGPEVDVCLGNVNGTTCSEALIGGFEKAFRNNNFSVVKNEKWVGGYITRHYGEMDDVEALQIELRFTAYLEGNTFGEDEVPGWDSKKFTRVKQRLHGVFTQVISNLF